MRLTLRTLLAWMDGVLPEDFARQMAEKVAGSALAQTLAGRIREVVARPTVGAPPADGRGLAADPNSAAEFLDNVLAADRLADFERCCIESDMQLAEVADCHRLLADLTAGRATVGEVDAGLAERLRAVVAAEMRQDVAAQAMADALAGAPFGRKPLATAGNADDTVLVSAAAARRAAPATPPEAASRGPLRTWAVVATAAAVLIGLVGVLGWSVIRNGRRELAVQLPVQEKANPDAKAPAETAAGDATRDHASDNSAAVKKVLEPEPEPSREPVAEPSPEPVAEQSPPPTPEPKPEPEPVPEPPSESEPQPPVVPAVPPTVAARVPQGEALAIAAPAGVAAPAAAPGAAPGAAPVAEPAPPAAAPQQPRDAVVAGPFVLLVGTAPAAEQPLEWQARGSDAAVPVPAELVAPVFSQPELVIERVRIRLAPATRATLLRDGDGAVRLEVLFGRAVVVAEDPAARLGVTAAGISGRVTRGLEAPLGVEVTLEREQGSDPAAAPATRRARLVSAGGIAWEQTAEDGSPAAEPLAGFAADGRIPAGTVVAWSSGAADAVVLEPAAAAPAWLAGGEQVDAADRQAALGLAERLPADGPVQPALRQLAGDPRGEQRVLAAATLALLGDYDETVRQLSAEQRGRELYAGQWAKLESLTVPLALARGANAAARLAKAFADHGPAGSGETLARLARGFSAADLAAGADTWLVDALDDPHLVVRRYAFQRLTEAANPTAVDRLRYRPDGRPEQRREGVAWWREAVGQGRLRATAPAPR